MDLPVRMPTLDPQNRAIRNTQPDPDPFKWSKGVYKQNCPQVATDPDASRSEVPGGPPVHTGVWRLRDFVAKVQTTCHVWDVVL